MPAKNNYDHEKHEKMFSESEALHNQLRRVNDDTLEKASTHVIKMMFILYGDIGQIRNAIDKYYASR